MKGHLPPGITIVQSENFEEWLMDIRVLDSNPLYQDQTFRLKFSFNSKYPIGTFAVKRQEQMQKSDLVKEG